MLDTTQSGRKKIPKTKCIDIFKKEDIIPLSNLMNAWVNVPSVFSKTTIFRKLSLKELLHIKDLPTTMIKVLNRRKISKHLLSLIINVAPSKLLWNV